MPVGNALEVEEFIDVPFGLTGSGSRSVSEVTDHINRASLLTGNRESSLMIIDTANLIGGQGEPTDPFVPPSPGRSPGGYIPTALDFGIPPTVNGVITSQVRGPGRRTEITIEDLIRVTEDVQNRGFTPDHTVIYNRAFQSPRKAMQVMEMFSAYERAICRGGNIRTHAGIFSDSLSATARGTN